jgi:hypothetical protein
MPRALLAFSLLIFGSIAIAQSPAKATPNSPQSAAQAPVNSPQGNAKAPVKKDPLLPYAGNWIGAFENKPWILLNLNLAGEKLSGSIQRAKSIDLNDSGEIKHVSEEFVTLPLADGALNPDGLLLTFRDANTQETQRYTMKLSVDGTAAEIKMIAMNMPPGMPKPKPWKLMKLK